MSHIGTNAFGNDYINCDFVCLQVHINFLGSTVGHAYQLDTCIQQFKVTIISMQ